MSAAASMTPRPAADFAASKTEENLTVTAKKSKSYEKRSIFCFPPSTFSTFSTSR
jgi:hypothetical protein